MSMTFDDWLAETRRRTSGCRPGASRSSRAPPTRTSLDLAGNDYLGFTHDPRVVAAAADARSDGEPAQAHHGWSPARCTIHQALETVLAAWIGAPAALVHSTGYHANLAAVTALTDADTLVVSDAHVHASLVDACRLSRRRVVVTPHGDVAAVDQALRGRSEPRALVLIESVYSVLGDAAPLAELADDLRDATTPCCWSTRHMVSASPVRPDVDSSTLPGCPRARTSSSP